jgi:hypothetical protein
MDNVTGQIVLSAIEAWAEMLNLAAWKPHKRSSGGLVCHPGRRRRDRRLLGVPLFDLPERSRVPSIR